VRNGNGTEEAAIKQGYAKQVVVRQARKFGWQINDWKTNAAGNPVAVIKRRA
jgi:hypothetical protein